MTITTATRVDFQGAMKKALVGAVAAFAVECGGAGPYGHASRYVELDQEGAAVASARAYDPAMAHHRAEESRKTPVVLFGVVENRFAGSGGQALLKLSVRKLEPRNWCERAAEEDSCRVTVGDRDFGVVWALVSLRAEDDMGSRAIGQRSLVRIAGALGQDVSPADGAPVVHAAWYRHWPPFHYATPAGVRH
ncbi:MAG TPA: hypothetical protein VGY54_22190 [Polyangiaceae bacterium]|nr:hypothetical protein [Polyangiaceae bacterium]